jgi:hypothetical protein
MTGIASKTELLAVTAAVLVAGCWQSTQDLVDRGADGVVDSDGDVRVDVDVVDDGGGGSCDGSWLDPTTGYLWENPPSTTQRTRDEGTTYCDGLTLCGSPVGGWHLPTISELRSIIRDCPDTMTGGACGGTDSCLSDSCFSGACSGCVPIGGPGPGGCYWDGLLAGACTLYWSSSFDATSLSGTWIVAFNHASVAFWVESNLAQVRCVRSRP